MNVDWNPPCRGMRKQKLNRWVSGLGLLLMPVVFAFSCQFLQGPRESAAPGPPSQQCSLPQKSPNSSADGLSQPQIPPPPSEPDHIFTRVIEPGDNLSALFDRYQIGQGILCQIMAADESLLALDILRPGNTLTFTLDEQTRKLVRMELGVHPGKRVIYHRIDENSFDYEEILIPGEWEQQILSGEIDGSFYASALKSGLSDQETVVIADLFKEKLNFSRDIRGGDQFQVVRSQQFVEGQGTGQSRIEGIRILRGNRIFSAFLFEDGNYYDQKGESLARAFLRYPTRISRVSSHFNRARRHPITGRIAPHNGVDFPMPVGTPVLATGDGRVTRVENHPFAGRYLEIRHGGRYVTRYLHLSRIFVKQGQSVRRAERIALSGNTGRSTGPHLHFELHVKERPVNPLTAEIPTLVSVPKAKRKQFQERVSEIVAIMGPPDGQVAVR